jgi:hypothetical protein
MSKYIFICSAGHRGREESTYNLDATDLPSAIKEAHQCIVEIIGGEDAEYPETDPEEGLSPVRSARLIEVVSEHNVKLKDPALYQVYTDRIKEIDAASEERSRAADLRQLQQLPQQIEYLKAKLGVK